MKNRFHFFGVSPSHYAFLDEKKNEAQTSTLKHRMNVMDVLTEMKMVERIPAAKLLRVTVTVCMN